MNVDADIDATYSLKRRRFSRQVHATLGDPDVATNMARMALSRSSSITSSGGGSTGGATRAGTALFDAGSPEPLLLASNFVQTGDRPQQLMIASPKDVACRMSFIDARAPAVLANRLPIEHGNYLRSILQEAPVPVPRRPRSEADTEHEGRHAWR